MQKMGRVIGVGAVTQTKRVREGRKKQRTECCSESLFFFLVGIMRILAKGSGEMAQSLRAPDALLKDEVTSQRSRLAPHNHLALQLQRFLTPQVHIPTHAYTQSKASGEHTHTHIHIIKGLRCTHPHMHTHN